MRRKIGPLIHVPAARPLDAKTIYGISYYAIVVILDKVQHNDSEPSLGILDMSTTEASRDIDSGWFYIPNFRSVDLPGKQM